jgi:hypothetical protein
MNARPALFVLLGASALSLGTGCNSIKEKLAEKAAEKVTEKVIEKGTGAKGVDLSKDGVKIEGANGEKFEMSGTGAKLPDGWPAFLPAYTGAKIIAATSAPTGSSVVMRSSDTPDQVFAFYKSKAEAAGFKKAAEMSLPQSKVGAFQKDGSNISLTVSSDTSDKMTTVCSISYAAKK